MPIVVGRRPVEEALRGQRDVKVVHVADNAPDNPVCQQILALCDAREIPVIFEPRPVLDKLSQGSRHQGIVAEVAAYKYHQVSDLIEATSAQSQALIIALDHVVDPQNYGAIIRTAVAAGADGIVVARERAAPVSPAVVRAAAGATERAMVAQGNLSQALDQLKSASYWVIGADAAAQDLVWDVDLAGKVVFVFGSEGSGLSRLVAKKCDMKARIPLASGMDSLNVSVAAAIMIYEAIRQRR